MSGSEDWRRQRAEELRLHDAGPLAARPARDRRPATDDVEPMLRPVVAPEPIVPRVEESARYRKPDRGAEPVSRRYRQQSPLLSGAAVAAVNAASPRMRRSPRFAIGQPTALVAAVSLAMVGAGALGWVLHSETSPVRTIAPSATRAASADLPAVAVVPATARPAAPAPSNTVTSAPLASGVANAPARDTAAMPPAILQHRSPKYAITKAASLQSAAVIMPRRIAPKGRAATAIATRRLPVKLAGAARTGLRPAAFRNVSARWMHPAKAVALPGRNFRPSFNCRRAIAAVNKAICANSELSSLDRQVSEKFYRSTANVNLERHKAIDRDQVDFLNLRARCNSDDCVARVYHQRLDALRERAPGE